MHVAAQLVAELLALVLVRDRLEAIDRGLEVALHVRVVGRALALRRLVEDLRERLDLAPVVDLRLIELVLQRLELRRVGGLRAAPSCRSRA